LRRLVHGSPGRPAGPPHSRGAGAPTQVAYYNWAGYADDNSTGRTYTYVSGKWSQPALSCPTMEYQIAVFWVGLDGFNNSTVEQSGTFAECYLGSAYYYTWWEMYPTNDIQIVGTAKPADAVTATVRYASGKYTLVLTDATTSAASFSVVETCASNLTCARASAEWIAETPGTARGYVPLPDFHTWKLQSAHVYSGATHGVISTFPDDQITMVSTAPYDLASTSALNVAGNAFTVTWQNSY
jgi:hypothetical protein